MSDPRPPDGTPSLIGMSFKLAVVKCPACGEELHAKVSLAPGEGTGQASKCTTCGAPLLLWAEAFPEYKHPIVALPSRDPKDKR